MKKIVITVLLACFGFQSFFGQEQLRLSLKKDSDKTVNETEHFYLMEIKNNANKSIEFSISTENVACENVSAQKQVPLNQNTLNKQKSNTAKSMSIGAGETLEFYVKISRPKNTKLNTWNCSEVKAISKTGKSLSNPIIIKSLIPDPKSFN
ncbi:hypothetical protein [uncultured Psychroserpens sp.]|uniref:hypothetical protein n=1 Tax=uncultured Psychroserpens sp. TaxID=255436 RepID=UPI002619DAA5|nr:hypothetical protein [uncultured Psychroserpens sp.]